MPADPTATQTPMAAPRPLRRTRLSSRMAAMSLALLLVVQLLSFGAIRASIERNARRQLAAQLDVGTRIWQRLLEQRAGQLSQGAAVLAADFGFRAAVGSNDAETIMSALDNHGARIGASVAALLDSRLAVKAVSQDSGAIPLETLTRIAPLLTDRGSTVAMVGDRAMQFVMVPMRAPLLIGQVVMGFELDAEPIGDLQAVSGLHGSLVRFDNAGAGRLLQSSAPAESAIRGLALDPATPEAGGWVQRSLAVESDGGGRLVLQLAGSVAQAVAPYQD